MSTTTLSFTIRVAQDIDDLQRACEVRAASYGHHMPELEANFAKPDVLDLSSAVAVLLCEDKATGEAIGTARVQTNAFEPLLIEQCIDVPAPYAKQGRAEITRLATLPGADLLIKIALQKAVYLYCQAAQARWMIITARNDALVRNYLRLGFTDVYEDRRMVPLSYIANIPHRVLVMDTFAVERNSLSSRHALYDFFFRTQHPDIQLLPRSRIAPQLRAVAA